MRTTKMTRNEQSRQNRAYAPALTAAVKVGRSQDWKGTREQRGNNLGNTLTPYLSTTYIYLILFVPLFPNSNRFFIERPPLSLSLKKTKTPSHISLPSRQEQGTREQSGFE